MNKMIQRYAYQYIGPLFESRLDSFESLRRDLRKAGMDISLRMYLSMAVFQSIIGFVLSLFFMIIIKLLISALPITFIIIVPIIVAVSTYVIKLIIPSSKIGDRKRKIEASMPSAASYMAAMSSSGVTPDEIFISLANDDLGLFISHDAKKIVRDIKIFGLDIIRALENAAKRSPSVKYATFLEGINATNTSGGDLQGYFENASKALMRDKIQTEKGFIEILGLYAELFLVACIVTPTFAIILIAMVALQGGMDHSSLTGLVLLIGFVLIPIFQLVIIVLVDGSQPIE